jgi:hypothetical protein
MRSHAYRTIDDEYRADSREHIHAATGRAHRQGKYIRTWQTVCGNYVKVALTNLLTASTEAIVVDCPQCVAYLDDISSTVARVSDAR